ncbi:hypothetical protein PO124_05805 [Bacillus licheniformis]|nr:hypothetical protein [Bacillus licheniformis]
MNRGAAILSICLPSFLCHRRTVCVYSSDGKVNGEVLAQKANEQYEKSGRSKPTGDRSLTGTESACRRCYDI